MEMGKYLGTYGKFFPQLLLRNVFRTQSLANLAFSTVKTYTAKDALSEKWGRYSYIISIDGKLIE